MAVTSAGTHELLVYEIDQMPFVGTGGPGDLIDERLRRNPKAFTRIELGGATTGNRTGPRQSYAVDRQSYFGYAAAGRLGKPSPDGSHLIGQPG